MNKYQRLDWDSDFFGVEVFMIDKGVYNALEMNEILESLNRDSCGLAYYATKKPLNIPNNFGPASEVRLVDQKVTYSRKLRKQKSIPKDIETYSNYSPDAQLIKLSIQSGEYSRFKVDERISEKDFIALYTAWVINSVNGKIANKVLVYNVRNDIAGFISLKNKQKATQIGLIAVDESFRGQGIGKALIDASDHWAGTWGCDSLEVVTQGTNQQACRFYETNGFNQKSVEFLYHFWF